MPTRALIVRAPRPLADIASSLLFDAGARGVEVRERSRYVELVVYCDARDAAFLQKRFGRLVAALARRTPKANKIAIGIDTVSGEWTTAWTETLRPVQLTKSFVVCPGSTETDAKRGIVIRLEPGLVFGYGEHPTTRMAAKRIEAFCRRHPGCSVLDFGSGSGVLAIVAALSGARRIVGLDVDGVAVRAARLNAKKNNVAICHFSGKPLKRITEQFDCAVANVDAKTVLLVRNDLAHVSRPGALLLLTGFLGDDVASIEASYATDFDIARRSRDDSWILLELRRRGRNVTQNVTKLSHPKL